MNHPVITVDLQTILMQVIVAPEPQSYPMLEDVTYSNRDYKSVTIVTKAIRCQQNF